MPSPRTAPLVPFLLAPLLLGLAAGCAPPQSTTPVAAPATTAPRNTSGFQPAPIPSDAANEFAARRAANLAPAADSAVTQLNASDRGDVDLQLPPMPTGASPAFRAN